MKYILFLTAVIILPLSCTKADSLNKSDEILADSRFRITEKELILTLDALPEKIKEKIIAEKSEFIQLLADVLYIMKNDENSIFYPADKKRFLEAGFEPSDLVTLDNEGFKLNKQGMQIRSTLMSDLKDMISAAASDGVDIQISSAYRSYDYQKNLFKYYSNTYGEAEAEKFSARAGTSQHQLGTALDFGSISSDFQDTEAGKWIKENSWLYGFSLSYPENLENITGYQFEPWHYRYITKQGVLLEQKYFDGLQYLLLDYLFVNSSVLTEKLEIK